MKKIISVKKQGGGYSLYCGAICKAYGIEANQIHIAHAMLCLGIEGAGGTYENSPETYDVLGQAEMEANKI